MHIITRRKMISVAAAGLITPTLGTEVSSAASLDAKVADTLRNFHRRVTGTRELVADSAAVLVFPTVIKAGIGIGGEYGEGSLLSRGRSTENYNMASASVGFQLGAQARSIIIVFMTEQALADFKRVDGWKVGVDGSVALINVGVGGSIDTTRIASPIVGFIFDGKGLMYNLTLEEQKSAGWCVKRTIRKVQPCGAFACAALIF